MSDQDGKPRCRQTIMQPGPLQGGLERDRDRAAQFPQQRHQRLEFGRQTSVIANDLAVAGQHAQREVPSMQVQAGVVHRASVGWLHAIVMGSERMPGSTMCAPCGGSALS